jgi:hypothetical protein
MIYVVFFILLNFLVRSMFGYNLDNNSMCFTWWSTWFFLFYWTFWYGPCLVTIWTKQHVLHMMIYVGFLDFTELFFYMFNFWLQFGQQQHVLHMMIYMCFLDSTELYMFNFWLQFGQSNMCFTWWSTWVFWILLNFFIRSMFGYNLDNSNMYFTWRSTWVFLDFTELFYTFHVWLQFGEQQHVLHMMIYMCFLDSTELLVRSMSLQFGQEQHVLHMMTHVGFAFFSIITR